MWSDRCLSHVIVLGSGTDRDVDKWLSISQTVIHIQIHVYYIYVLNSRFYLPLDWYFSYLREAGGTGVEQEWWIALCIVACVGQTPRGQISTSQ